MQCHWMLTGEVAKRLQVHPDTVVRWARNGILKSEVNDHGWRMFDCRDVKKLFESRQAKGKK